MAGFAFWGAGLGSLLVVAHEAHEILTGGFHDVDPFGHILLELVAAGLGGAFLLAAAAWLHNRLLTD